MTDAVVVICTRPDSSRLPRKVFKKIAGVPTIEHILSRLKVRKGFDKFIELPVILAVPNHCNEYEWLYEKYHIQIFHGNPESPLHRMADAVKWYGRNYSLPKYVVRITHDDLLIDYPTIFELLESVESENAGYGITPKIIEGAGVEVIHTANLMAAAEKNKEAIEHISYFVKGDSCPNSKIVLMEPRKEVQRNYRLTLDHQEDAVVLESVFRKIGPLASNDAICAHLDQNPFLLSYNKLPEVSVYTCARNAGRWVQETISTVTNAYHNMEYVVVEDSSTDDTLDKIMCSYKKDFSVVVNESNLGLASSSNVALGKCRGRYTMRVDADDKLAPHAIERMMDSIKNTGAAVVYSNYSVIDEENNVVEQNADARKYHHAGCAMMDSKLINQIRFKDGLKHWDSLDLYQRVHERFPIAYIDEPLWFYRKHMDSMSSSGSQERKEAFNYVMTKGE